jgi:hypothetical protein
MHGSGLCAVHRFGREAAGVVSVRRLDLHHFAELIAILEKEYPEDEWFRQRDAWGDEFANCFPQFSVYDAAIQLLDEQSWRVLTEKVSGSFRQPFAKRGKQNFFNDLNEILAYEYLKKDKCVEPKLLEQLRLKERPEWPDLSFGYQGSQYCCEVKTIGLSDIEINWALKLKSFDPDTDSDEEQDTGTLIEPKYEQLSVGFFSKFKSDIDKAKKQIFSYQAEIGMIYFVVHFDDFTHMFYGTYRQQITEFLEEHYPDTAIIMRIGVDVPKYITHQENLIFKPAQS